MSSKSSHSGPRSAAFRSFRAALAAILLLALPAAAQGGLRQQVVHVAYSEGDFDEVVREIEAFMWSNPTWSRSDSLFIFKHLGVVHAAGAETRERGKAHLARLLELQPSADLADMYVSDEIARLFAALRAEARSRAQPQGADPGNGPTAGPASDTAGSRAAGLAAPAPGPRGPEAPAPARSVRPAEPFYRKRGFWMAAGAGLAAVGAGTAVAVWAHTREEPEDLSIRIRGESDP